MLASSTPGRAGPSVPPASPPSRFPSRLLSTPSPPPLPGSLGPWGQRTPQCTPRRNPGIRSSVTPSPTCLACGSSNSSTPNQHDSEWYVPGAQAMTGRVEEKMGRGRLSSVDADAEKTLSSLFVSDEMAKHQEKPRGWGALLIGSAVSATVFGAAIGLTAYRIWTGGWGSIVNSDDPHDSEPLPTQEYDDMYNDTNEAESIPPLPFPHSRTTHRSYSSERYAASTGSSTSPRRRHHSSPGSAYRRRRRAQRPTIAELLAITAQSPSASASTFGRALSPDSDVMSVSGFTGMTEGGPSSPTSRTTLEPITGSDGGSGSESDDETNARLAAMAQRVQGLITEGRAALSSPVSTLKSCPVQAADFPVPPPRDSPPPIDVLKPRPRSVRVSGWDKDTDTTAEERPRRASSASMVAPIMSPALGSSIGIGPPPARPTTSRPVSVGSFPRSSSVSSNSSRYQPIIPPLPWRRESVGVTSRWVQKQHSPSGSISGSSTDNTSTTRRINNGEVPLVLNRANPTTSKNRDRPESARPDSARSDSARPGSAQPDSSRHDSPHLHSPRQHDNGSRIPRPGAHSRASSVTSGTDSVVKVHPTRDLTSPLRARSSASNSSNADRAGWNSPAPPQGLVAARTSLFTTAAERNADTNTHINRSKIPISRSMGSMGSISSITAVQTPSPKA